MSDTIQNVCNWSDETEEDNLLYDSDDTDADPDFVCTNTRNEIDSESDTDVDVHINPSSSRINNALVSSRSRSRSPLVRDNSSYYLGKDCRVPRVLSRLRYRPVSGPGTAVIQKPCSRTDRAAPATSRPPRGSVTRLFDTRAIKRLKYH